MGRHAFDAIAADAMHPRYSLMRNSILKDCSHCVGCLLKSYQEKCVGADSVRLHLLCWNAYLAWQYLGLRWAFPYMGYHECSPAGLVDSMGHTCCAHWMHSYVENFVRFKWTGYTASGLV
eukprot:7226175-Karenia_brevis.AAC.1